LNIPICFSKNTNEKTPLRSPLDRDARAYG
jgi:hypothetical protein